MPAVTVFSKPNGEPIASTHWPGLMRDGSPSFTVGRLVALILITATSVRSSAPITLAWNSRRSVSRTVTSSAFADHVGVGEDVAVGADDEARARAAHRRLIRVRRLLGRGDAEAAEEVVERIVGRQALRDRRGLRLLHHLDVDDRRAVALDQRREVRQRPQRDFGERASRRSPRRCAAAATTAAGGSAARVDCALQLARARRKRQRHAEHCEQRALQAG